MLHFELDTQSALPAYRQLMDQLKYYTASGALGPGDRLPSIRTMARTLRVNPTTVVKAYTELEHEGVLESRHGVGVFLSASPARPSLEELREALRERARRLAVEAAQMSAEPELVLQLVQEELEALRNGEAK